MLKSDNSKNEEELLLKIKQLEFDNQVLEAQNNYMKDNIKLYKLQTTPKDKKDIILFLKKLKSKIWRR
jgi:hypothetical protein